MASDDVVTGGDPKLDYTLQEIGQIQSNRFAQEAFEQQQTQWNASMDGHMTRLIKAIENLGKKPPDAAASASTMATPRGWNLPPSTTIKPTGFNQDSWPKLKMDPPWLSASLKHELLIRRPASLSDAIALAQQLSACQAATSSDQSLRPRPTWQSREFKQPQKAASTAPKPTDSVRLQSSQPRQQRESRGPTDYPVIHISAAERAERTKKGLCWWCPEKYSRSHICSKKFYAFMGDDEDSASVHGDEETFADEEAENMVISADISRVLVIGPKLKPRSIRVTGMIHKVPGTRFDIDLFLLQVEGPDVILGVQWLQDLGKVLLDFRDLTMEFLWNQSPVILKGEDKPPKQP
ncbi:hypothetical protein SASPL_110042 [Salvia splendens]|uniref:Uncharacterized protein n=1 Tax=Salvia splendens TaxID=180675 RepID=A0A8X9A143_SALSN|nr:hypothetical protein SASPL_110042 [Salvia splendens]